MASDKDRPIGSKAKRNGKEVIWAGQDYGFQSPASFNKLKDKGELALGAGLVRRVNQVGRQWEEFRHNTFGTMSDDHPAVRLNNAALEGMSKLPGGKAQAGAEKLGAEGAKRLGVSPALGAMFLGSVVPGGGGSGAKWGTNRQLSRATRQRQRQMVDGTPSPKLQELAGQELPRQPRGQRHGTRQGDSRPLNESARQPPRQGDTQQRRFNDSSLVIKPRRPSRQRRERTMLVRHRLTM
jgi:hypothetical protein